jgi:predicted DNA binding CopG/RHH family protein
VANSTHLSTWVDAEDKQRFAAIAVRQGLSASAFLKRLVQQVLAASSADDTAVMESLPPRDTRITIRLIAEDEALLRERAAARTMPVATYVSALVRAHLRHVAPLPEKELVALKSAVNELVAVGRNLNTMTRLMHQDVRQTGPGRSDLWNMLRICEALRDHSRELIKANLASWKSGHAA